METIVARATKADVRPDPFPHLILDNAIDDGLVADLIQNFPPLSAIAEGREPGSNKRFSYGAEKVGRDTSITPIWKEFIAAHVTRNFLQQVLELFADQIRTLYPRFESTYGNFSALRAGIRRKDDFTSADVLLDAQICVNSPVVGTPTTVRSPHVDLADKLFAGLFYLRHPDDSTVGGDLELHRLKGDQPFLYGYQSISPRDVEPVGSVPYRANTLIIFVNSPYSVHGVTVRAETTHPRLFMNVLGEVREPLFDPAAYREGTWRRLKRRLGY